METRNGYTLLQQTGTNPNIYLAISPTGENCELRLCAPCRDGTPDPLALCYANNQWALAHCYAHPNIQKTLDMWWDSDGVVTVVERCPGGTLESYVAENGRRLSVPCTMGIMTQILDALGHIHETDVTYKQCGNQTYGVLEPGVILLADMGKRPAVKLRAPYFIRDDQEARSLEKRLAPNPMLANFYRPMLRFYWPRWWVMDARYRGPEDDLWPAAALLYFMLTGYPPKIIPYRHDKNWGELAIWGSVIPFSQRGVHVPEPLEELLISMLSAKMPQEMPFHTAAAFKEALEGAV